MQDHPSKLHWLWLIPVLLLVTWFGMSRINADTLWFDEWWSFFNAGHTTFEGHPEQITLGLRQVWQRVEIIDPIHPPGFYFALNIWSRIFGWNTFSARYMSLVAAVLAVAVMYQIGKGLHSKPVGLYAATILGTLAFYVHYTHEIRMYTLVILLGTMFMWAYWRWAQYGTNWLVIPVYVVSLAGLAYTQYLNGFLIIAVGLYHIFFGRKDRRWWWITLVTFATALVYVPWAEAAWGIFSGRMSNTDGETGIPFNQILTAMIYVFSNGIPLLLIPFLAPASWARSRGHLFALWVTGCVLILVIITAYFSSLFQHLRYTLVAWVPIALLMGFAVNQLARWRIPPALPLVFWVILGIFNYDRIEIEHNRSLYWTPEWEVLGDTVLPLVENNDVILMQAPGDLLSWALEQSARYYLFDQPARVEITPLRIPSEGDTLAAQLADQLDNTARVWSAYDPSLPTIYKNDIETYLIEQEYESCGVVLNAKRLYIELYHRLSEGNCPTLSQVNDTP